MPVKPLVSKDKRPVNLDIGTMKLPVTAYVSISHRLSGVFLFVMSGLLVWALDMSLSSEAGFAQLAALLSTPLAKVLLWATASAISYHAFAGIKHLIMDMGVGETMAGGVMGARIVIALAVLAAAAWGMYLW